MPFGICHSPTANFFASQIELTLSAFSARFLPKLILTYFCIMKYIYLLLLIGCTKKEPEGMVHIPYEGRTAARSAFARSAFPSSVYMGRDSVITRQDSFAFIEFTSYLATCGTSPETEVPYMGTKVYPILFPSCVIINWIPYQGRMIPTAKNLGPGVYKFVGAVWMYGFRTCDSTYQDVLVTDTMTLTVLKKHRYGK